MSLSKNTTIVIVTYNGFILNKTLNRLNKKFKVIIVENSNLLKFKAQVEKKYKNIKVLLTKKNYGFAVANNLALKKVSTQFSLILNPDVSINEKQVLELEKTAKKINNFGILTCSCNGLLETVTSYVDKFEKVNTNTSQTDKDLMEIPFVPGWCMFVKTKNLKKVKYFDENFFLYFEDKDLSKRIKTKKNKLLIAKKIKIHHIFGRNSKILKKKELREKSWHCRFWHFYWSSFYFYRKHYGFFTAFRIHLTKFLRFRYLSFFYKLINNRNLSELNRFKSNGILSQFLNKKALSGPIPG